MSKPMGRIIYLLTVLLAIQIYALVIYEYGEAYGFNDQINPISIIAASLALIGIAALIGRILNDKDAKRGYCESGISEKKIEEYQTAHLKSQSTTKGDDDSATRSALSQGPTHDDETQC